MKIVRTAQCDPARLVEGVKRRLSPFEVNIPEESREKAIKVFGQEISPIESVRRILEDVKNRGDEALLFYGCAFDGVNLSTEDLKVKEEEVEEAYRKVHPPFLEALRKAKDNITTFQRHIKLKAPSDLSVNGTSLKLLYRPIERVGIYVPGGKASYPSTVLMCAIPARVAGVEKIIMVTPPGRDGKIGPERLVAARETGVDEVYKIGGVQAIGAMAFGTLSIPKVDKIVGPGNVFVTLAKREVYGYVDIDMLAGPSEVVILADDDANPELIASDLLSQAEHPGSAILITDSQRLAEEVSQEVEKQLAALSSRDLARKSLEGLGLIIVTQDLEEAIGIANQIAPEHIELQLKRPKALVSRVRHAGTVFLGDSSPVALGDYIAGPSHVLPTGGTARFFSGLTVNDFLKKVSVISYSKKALKGVASEVITLAEAEGLPAHAQSVRVRLR